MFYSDSENTENCQRIPKTRSASNMLLMYFCNLAEQEGLDSETLASIHFSKDVADLSETEVSTLIAAINEE